MADLDQKLDPEAPQINREVLLLLMDHFKNLTVQNNAYQRDLTLQNNAYLRELTNEKIEAGISGVCNEIVKLRNASETQVTAQSVKLADLKLKTDTDGVHFSINNSTLAKNLSDHMTKSETLIRYLEERVCSLELIILQQSLSQRSPYNTQPVLTPPPPHRSTPLHSSAATPVSMAGTAYNQATRLVTVHLQENNNIQFLQPSLVTPDASASTLSPSKRSPTPPSLQTSPLPSPLLSTQTWCPDLTDCSLVQVDGNMTLSNISDPAIVSAGPSNTSLSNQMTSNIRYNYKLNSVNQTNRLFENTAELL